MKAQRGDRAVRGSFTVGLVVEGKRLGLVHSCERELYLERFLGFRILAGSRSLYP